MRYELPVPSDKFNEMTAFEKGIRSYVLFRSTQDQSQLFIYCHGSKEGELCLSGHLYSSREVLKLMIKNKLIHERGIKAVSTICCHGGMQETVTIEGVTISSSHPSKEEIYCRTFMTMDDECFLNLVI